MHLQATQVASGRVRTTVVRPPPSPTPPPAPIAAPRPPRPRSAAQPLQPHPPSPLLGTTASRSSPNKASTAAGAASKGGCAQRRLAAFRIHCRGGDAREGLRFCRILGIHADSAVIVSLHEALLVDLRVCVQDAQMNRVGGREGLWLKQATPCMCTTRAIRC